MLFRNRSDRRNREMKRERGTFIAVERTQISLGKTFMLDFAVCSGLLIQSECLFHFIASIQTVVSCHVKMHAARVIATWCRLQW